MPLRRAHKPKHCKPSKCAPILAVGGLTVSIGMVEAGAFASSAAAATTTAAATSDDFAQLRLCESSDNYAINTGNGYYGAYQFDVGTWRGLGNTGLASEATPAAQDTAAAQLQANRGWSPWPACSQKLGLGRHGAPAASASSGNRTVVVAASETLTPLAPVFAGTDLTAALVSQQRQDVSAWQQRMSDRGWAITVDGFFGRQSAQVADRFAAEKGLQAAPGTVGKVSWNAAWSARIT